MTPREQLSRIVEAMARLDTSIESLSNAIRVVNPIPTTTLGGHEILKIIDQASERARVARAKLEILRKRIPCE